MYIAKPKTFDQDCKNDKYVISSVYISEIFVKVRISNVYLNLRNGKILLSLMRNFCKSKKNS